MSESHPRPELTQAGSSPLAQSLETVLDPAARTAWFYNRCPHITPTLIREFELARISVGQSFVEGARPFDYLVLASRLHGIFSRGGDLAHFKQAIEARSREVLREYAHACCELLHQLHNGLGHRAITLALVQGDALGGGFEVALSCDVVIAERRARFALPESSFNLFPGMGAMSFLSRKLGTVKAQEMMLSGRVYTAEDLHGLGLVDVLAEDGAGEEAVRGYIDERRPKHNAQSAIYQARRIAAPLTLEELIQITDLWVDAALRLTKVDLRRMGHLVAIQKSMDAKR